MAGRVPEEPGAIDGKQPIIVRIVNGMPNMGWRVRLATYLRRLSIWVDDGHMIVINTDDRVLVRNAVDGCVKLMMQKHAQEMFEAHKAYVQKAGLANWNPQDGAPQ